MPAGMDLAEPNPVDGEVFSQMSFLVLVHGAASALVQGTSLDFFLIFSFCRLQVEMRAMADITRGG